jgi:hypothetical protein
MTRAAKEDPIKLKRKMYVTLGPIYLGLTHFFSLAWANELCSRSMIDINKAQYLSSRRSVRFAAFLKIY